MGKKKKKNCGFNQDLTMTGRDKTTIRFDEYIDNIVSGRSLFNDWRVGTEAELLEMKNPARSRRLNDTLSW